MPTWSYTPPTPAVPVTKQDIEATVDEYVAKRPAHAKFRDSMIAELEPMLLENQGGLDRCLSLLRRAEPF